MTAGTEEGYTALERTLLARNRELERRIVGMEELYDKAAADLIEALDVASAYRATASTLHQEIERRNVIERRQAFDFTAMFNRRQGKTEWEAPARSLQDRRKSWPC
jgi:hypothetical protein